MYWRKGEKRERERNVVLPRRRNRFWFLGQKAPRVWFSAAAFLLSRQVLLLHIQTDLLCINDYRRFPSKWKSYLVGCIVSHCAIRGKISGMPKVTPSSWYTYSGWPGNEAVWKRRCERKWICGLGEQRAAAAARYTAARLQQHLCRPLRPAEIIWKSIFYILLLLWNVERRFTILGTLFFFPSRWEERKNHCNSEGVLRAMTTSNPVTWFTRDSLSRHRRKRGGNRIVLLARVSRYTPISRANSR